MDKNPWKSALNGQASQPQETPSPSEDPLITAERIAEAEDLLMGVLESFKAGKVLGLMLFVEEVATDEGKAQGLLSDFNGRFFLNNHNYGLLGFATTGLQQLGASWVNTTLEGDDEDE